MKKIPLLLLALLVTNTSLQAQTIAVDTDIQEVLVSASLVPIAVSRSGNAVTIIDREQLKNTFYTWSFPLRHRFLSASYAAEAPFPEVVYSIIVVY